MPLAVRRIRKSRSSKTSPRTEASAVMVSFNNLGFAPLPAWYISLRPSGTCKCTCPLFLNCLNCLDSNWTRARILDSVALGGVCRVDGGCPPGAPRPRGTPTSALLRLTSLSRAPCAFDTPQPSVQGPFSTLPWKILFQSTCFRTGALGRSKAYPKQTPGQAAPED